MANGIRTAAGKELDNVPAPGEVVELAIKTAEPAVRELGASPDIERMEIEQQDRPAA